jgi:hypothetical protein
MGNCTSTSDRQAKAHSDAIDKEIETDSKKFRKECKILLLGALFASHSIFWGWLGLSFLGVLLDFWDVWMDVIVGGTQGTGWVLIEVPSAGGLAPISLPDP